MGILLFNGNLSNTQIPFYYSDKLSDTTLFKKAKIRNDIANNLPMHIQIEDNQGALILYNGQIVDFCFQKGSYIIDSTTPPSCIFGNRNPNFMSFQTVLFTDLPYKEDGMIIYFVNFNPMPHIKLYTENPINYYDNGQMRQLVVNGSFAIDLIDPFKLFSKIVRNGNEEHFLTDVFEKKIEEDVEKGVVNAVIDYSNRQVPYPVLCQSANDIIARTYNSLVFPNLLGISIRNFEITNFTFKDIESNPYSEPVTPLFRSPENEFAGFNVSTIGITQEEPIVKPESKETANTEQPTDNTTLENKEAAKDEQTPIVKKPVIGNPFANDNDWFCPQCRNDAHGEKCDFCGYKRITPSMMQQSTPQIPMGSWLCSNCGTTNIANFCSNCGKAKPIKIKEYCDNCGWRPQDVNNPPKFCPECGTKYQV